MSSEGYCYYLRNLYTGHYFGVFGEVETTFEALTFYKKDDPMALDIMRKNPDQYEWIEDNLAKVR